MCTPINKVKGEGFHNNSSEGENWDTKRFLRVASVHVKQNHPPHFSLLVFALIWPLYCFLWLAWLISHTLHEYLQTWQEMCVCWRCTAIYISAGRLGLKIWAKAVIDSLCLVISLIWSHYVAPSMFSSLMANGNTDLLFFGLLREGFQMGY